MRVVYDPAVDILRIMFSSTPIEESDEEKLGVILDYDKDGNIVGMEMPNASERIDNLHSIADFELLERFIKKTEDKIDAAAICDALKEFEAGDTISLEQLKDKLGI